MLLWRGQVPFCHPLMFKKFLSLPNHSVRVSVKGEKLIVELDMDKDVELDIEVELDMDKLKKLFIFYGQRKP